MHAIGQEPNATQPQTPITQWEEYKWMNNNIQTAYRNMYSLEMSRRDINQSVNAYN